MKCGYPIKVRINNMNKQTKPLVSVLIPVYNGALYLEETVNSVRKSTYKNVEIILVDDVITTGATISECAKVLKENGANQVFALSVATPLNLTSSPEQKHLI